MLYYGTKLQFFFDIAVVKCFLLINCVLFGFFLLILWLKCRWLMLDSGMVTFCCFY